MCLTHQIAQTFSEDRANAFAERLLKSLNEAALSLMTSIGHRTGLFDTLATLPPATSHDIADKAGLHERYVREWLGAMATSGIVEYDPDASTYALPAEHAAFLTRRAAPNNVAVFAQYIPLLGAVEEDILTCFRQGGGVPYERYPRFHAVMAEDSGQTVLASLLEHILPLIPGLEAKLERGIRVLDVGCGCGRALNLMAARFPLSRFVGHDLSPEAIGHARAEAAQRGLTNVGFAVKDLSHFDEDAEAEAFDFVTTFDAVHDQAKPSAVLRGIARTLKQDGVYLMQDIHGSSEVHKNLDHPIGTLLYTISCLHCMTVSLAQGGDGLGAMWGRETAVQMLSEAGFENIEVHQLAHDFQNDYYVIRK
jgi:2-polyprenyl-3-methyl-5-hydroxy-6-metoxy-1,4-benzoquinol methylase